MNALMTFVQIIPVSLGFNYRENFPDWGKQRLLIVLVDGFKW